MQNKAESSDPESVATFGRIIEWVAGGGDAGEGAVAGFLRRCKEEVAKDVDAGIKMRGWDETELSSFEDDSERVQSELNNGWTSLKKQLAKSEEEVRRRAQRAAAEVIAGGGALSLADITRGRGPTEDRYLYIRLREGPYWPSKTRRVRTTTARSRSTIRRCKRSSAAGSTISRTPRPRSSQSAFPGAKTTTSRCQRGSQTGTATRSANCANACGPTRCSSSSRWSSASWTVAVSRDCTSSPASIASTTFRGPHDCGCSPTAAIAAGAADANLFVLDVEVLQNHRTGKRLWDHLYARIIKPGDFQLSTALPRLAEIAAGGGSELDIQRRIVDSLLEMTSEQLRARICGSREGHGLDMNAELENEARLVHATKQLAADGALPPVGDPKWEEEMGRMSNDDLRTYVKDKMDFAASKCSPFITLGAGAPYLPEKAYAVLYPPYVEQLSDELAQLAELPMDTANIIEGEDPHKIVFYKAQLGCALHAVKSLVDYERRYFAVKKMEIEEGGKGARPAREYAANPDPPGRQLGRCTRSGNQPVPASRSRA